jgi:hypothetical protein
LLQKRITRGRVPPDSKILDAERQKLAEAASLGARTGEWLS